jgi:hypothetical protein
MANRDCNGDYFAADGVRYYRCFWDGKLLTPPPAEHCPNCDRRIDAVDVGEVQVRTTRVVSLPSAPHVELPSTTCESETGV